MREDMKELKFYDVSGLERNGNTEHLVDADDWDLASDKKFKVVKEKIENDIGCRIKGSFKMYQVPSKMLFATDRDLWLIKKLQDEKPELFEKFSLEHYYESLSFGDINLAQQI